MTGANPPGITGGPMAAMLADMAEVWRRLLAEHAPDRGRGPRRA
ncbi:hypothetical protein [Pseudonocardia asaccharolytica]|nr:hypothetical protein [Pseudonocardia asaccharolytica]